MNRPIVPTSAIHFDDILAQAFGPLQCLAQLALTLGDTGQEVVGPEDMKSLGYVAKALHEYGSMRFFELLEEAEAKATKEENHKACEHLAKEPEGAHHG